MIKKIIVFIIPLCFVIAVALFMAGYDRVELGSDFYDFMKKVSLDFNNWNVEIPSIPKVNELNASYVSIIKILNALISFINFLIMLTNYIISIIQFALTIIYELFNFVDAVQRSNSSFIGLNFFLLSYVNVC